MSQLWRVEIDRGHGRWVVGGVIVHACVIVDSAPIFRKWRGSQMWEFRKWVRSRGGEVKLCRQGCKDRHSQG